jgi:hypothetical protein
MRMSPKQRAAFWERQKELEKEMDLKEIEEYKEVQRMIDEGEIGFLPEKISERILRRLVGSWSRLITRGGGVLGSFGRLSAEVCVCAVVCVSRFPSSPSPWRRASASSSSTSTWRSSSTYVQQPYAYPRNAHAPPSSAPPCAGSYARLPAYPAPPHPTFAPADLGSPRPGGGHHTDPVPGGAGWHHLLGHVRLVGPRGVCVSSAP